MTETDSWVIDLCWTTNVIDYQLLHKILGVSDWPMKIWKLDCYVRVCVLPDMQKIFRRDLANNCFHDQGWHKNASDDGILGYKLMVQTGDIINSIDRDLVNVYFT